MQSVYSRSAFEIDLRLFIPVENPLKGFQRIQFRMSIVFVYPQLNVKTVIFQTIQFSIQKQFHLNNSV